MKHLAVLERCGVVKVWRSGRQRWNRLDPEPLGGLEARWRPIGGEAGSREPAGRAEAPAAATEAPRAAVPRPAAATGGESGFTLQVFIDAAPWRVFDALTVNVASWWGAPHLLSPDATNLVLEPQPGGRFYEEWGHRQGALRAVVAAIKQDERLELTGAIFGAGVAALGFVLERREGGTLVTASLTGTEAPAASPSDGATILDDLVRARLKAFVEHGTRSGVAP
jgi:uncharacterized protein YndB with AHSA1/START domain